MSTFFKSFKAHILICAFVVFGSTIFSQNKSDESILVNNILAKLEKEHEKLTSAQKIKLFIEGIEIEKKDNQVYQTYIDLHVKFADLLINSGAHEKAIDHIKIAINISLKLKKTNTGGEYYLNSMLGSSYLVRLEYDSSDSYYQLAFKAALSQKQNYTIAAAYNNLGILFYKKENYSKAKSYFQKSLNSYFSQNTHRDKNFLTSIYDNIAELYLKTNQFDSSRVYYQLNYKIGVDSNIAIRVVQSQLGIAESYLKQNQASTAIGILNHLKEPLEKLKDNGRYNGFKLHYERLIFDYYLKTNSIDQARIQLDKINLLKQNLENENQKKLDKTLTDFLETNTDKLESELNSKSILLKVLKERNRLNTYINFLIIAIAGFIFIYFFNIYKKKMLVLKKEAELEHTKNQLSQAELKNTELERTKLEVELKYKEKDLENTALRAKNELVIKQEIFDNLTRIQKLPINNIPTELKRYTSNFYALINSTDKNKLLVENIELLNQKFHSNLKEKFPNLTQNEVELCGYIKLSMSSKEIALLKNVSYESIKMAKSRLKKKFNIAQNDKIEEVILLV
jgi:hypothetical protein